jgi:hypothetical protein
MHIIVVSASWCAPCKNYKVVLAEIAKSDASIQIEILDADAAADKEKISTVFGAVTQLPWTAICVDDKIKRRFFGAASRRQLLHHMSASKEA